MGEDGCLYELLYSFNNIKDAILIGVLVYSNSCVRFGFFSRFGLVLRLLNMNV